MLCFFSVTYSDQLRFFFLEPIFGSLFGVTRKSSVDYLAEKRLLALHEVNTRSSVRFQLVEAEHTVVRLGIEAYQNNVYLGAKPPYIYIIVPF